MPVPENRTFSPRDHRPPAAWSRAGCREPRPPPHRCMWARCTQRAGPRRVGRVDHELAQRPDERVEPVGRCAALVALRRHQHHLVLQLGEHAGVAHLALLVERADRLGAHVLAPAGGHDLHRQVGRGGPQGVRHHRPAEVALGHHPVRPPAAEDLGRPCRPDNECDYFSPTGSAPSGHRTTGVC